MVVYTYYGDADTSKLSELIHASGLTSLSCINTAGPDIFILFPEALSAEDVTKLSGVIVPYLSAYRLNKIVQDTIQDAITFAYGLIREFAAKNVLMGVTQANMTGSIINTLAPTLVALQGGSLYEAVSRLRAIPPASYDATFITAPRVLEVMNKIETYLGIPLTTEI